MSGRRGALSADRWALSAERGARSAEREARMSSRAKRGICTSVLGGVLLSAVGCSWFTDFKQQPKIDPWESVADSIPPRGNPQSSVPMYGTAAPGYVYGRTPLPAAIDSMSHIPNPASADQRSLNNGRINYQINCAVCHGPLGHGDGPATRFGMVPMSLVSDAAKGRSDGYIFSGALMLLRNAGDQFFGKTLKLFRPDLERTSKGTTLIEKPINL